MIGWQRIRSQSIFVIPPCSRSRSAGRIAPPASGNFNMRNAKPAGYWWIAPKWEKRA